MKTWEFKLGHGEDRIVGPGELWGRAVEDSEWVEDSRKGGC